MKNYALYWDSMALVAITILYILTASFVIPISLYGILSVLLMLVIFPGKIFLLLKKNDFSRLEAGFYVLSNLAIAYIIASTVLFLVMDKSDLMRLVALVCKVINTICALYFVNKGRKSEAVFCICALFMPTDAALF